MENRLRTEYLVECLVQIIGRASMPIDKVYEIVGSSTKYQKAFNLCDGSNNLRDISRKNGIDQGNFSRTVKRWVENGVVFWIGEGNEARPLHIYSIPEIKKARAKKKRTR
jgi:hypothetical protein